MSMMACSVCHQRKVKCDRQATGNKACTNCQIAGFDCRTYRRKRKRDFPPAPEPGSIATTTHRGSRAARLGAYRPANTSPVDPGSLEQDISLQEVSEPEKAYVGRTEVLGDVSFDESLVRGQSQRLGPQSGSSPVDSEVLTLYKAFEIPPPVEKDALVQHFMDSCQPWTPVVDMAWLGNTDGQPISLLLLQAVLVAGSQVATEEAWPASETFFNKAKALFFYQHEANPIIAVVTAIVLQWWSPMGPEKVSQSNSGFWLHIAAGLAYQVGLHKEPLAGPQCALRRRIWWSLVCRDIMISVGVGRPRTINLEDSDVLLPTIQDFPNADTNARLFVAYVGICQILGDVVQSCRRGLFTRARKQTFEAHLYQWARELPPDLCLFQGTDVKVLKAYDVGSRQLHVVYFVVVVILSVSRTSTALPATSLVAASFIAGIHAEFESHGDVRRLGPIFAFHILTAALSLLKAFKYATLTDCANRDFERIYRVLQRLAAKWGSARGLLTPLLAAKRGAEAQNRQGFTPAPVSIDESMGTLFRDCGPSALCAFWDLLWPAAGDLSIQNVPEGQGDNAPVERTSADPVVHVQNENYWDSFLDEYPNGFEGYSSVDQYWNELMGAWPL